MDDKMSDKDLESQENLEASSEETVEETPVTEAEPSATTEPAAEAARPMGKKTVAAIVAGAAVLLAILIGVTTHYANKAEDVAVDPAATTVATTTTTETPVSDTVIEGGMTSDLTLTVVDADGVFVAHDFVVADEVMTQEQADAIVATCGDQSLDNVTLTYYYYQKYMDLYSEYGSYITMILDPSQSLATQMYSETQSIQDMLLQNAITAYQTEAAVYNSAVAEGFQMSEDYAAYCADLPDLITADVQAQGYATADEYLIDFYGSYATMDSFMAYVVMSMTANEFMSTKAAELSNTDQEILDYFDANIDYYTYYGMSKDAYTVNVRHILVVPEADENATTDEYGSVVYSDESWAAALAQSEALLEEWQNGEATEDAFAALATEHTQDPGSAGTGGLYEGVYQGQMVTNFDAWCFDESRQIGDSGIVESNFGYHIMFYSGSQEDNSWYETAASDLLYNKQVELQNSYVSQWEFLVDYSNVALAASQLEVELAAAYGY